MKHWTGMSWLIILLIGAGVGVIHAEKAAVLAELKKPVSLAVDAGRVYITEQSEVFVYSSADYKLIARFGREGQGPREFQTLPHIPVSVDVSTDRLIVASMRKISYYTKTGEYIDETRAVNLALELRPSGDSFIGWSGVRDNGVSFVVINQYDRQLNKQKELFRVKDSFQGKGQGFRVLYPAFTYSVGKDFVVIPNADDRMLDILDKQFNKTGSVRVNAEPLPVGSDFRNKLEQFYRTSKETRDAWPFLQPLIFPDHFPAIADFFADGDRIWVMTWRRGKKGNQFFMYDSKGVLKGETEVPMVYETDIKPYPAFIAGDKLYQLVEGDGEDWELHVNRLKL